MIQNHDIDNIESYISHFQFSKEYFTKKLKQKKQCIECKYYLRNEDKIKIETTIKDLELSIGDAEKSIKVFSDILQDLRLRQLYQDVK
jgi:hypothetical protein